MPSLEERRRSFAQQICKVAHVRPGALMEAFAKVPRERFVGEPPWQITAAGSGGFRIAHNAWDLYDDVIIALKPEQGLNNGQPSALAHWIHALRLRQGERVFHIGCGTGYYTAILAEVVGPTGDVAAVELEQDLADAAKKNLGNYPNVAAHQGDGATFYPGPRDAILVNAGVTHPSPAWLSVLNPGGRMVLPLTIHDGSEAGGSGMMLRIVRSENAFSAEPVSRVGIYSSPSVRDPEAEAQLLHALQSGTLRSARSVRLDPHARQGSCVVHTAAVCLSAEEPGHCVDEQRFNGSKP